MEDYAANRKSGATAAVGATQPAGGLFGGAAQQTPVSQPGGLFGSQPKPAGFGKKAIHSLLIHSIQACDFPEFSRPQRSFSWKSQI